MRVCVLYKITIISVQSIQIPKYWEDQGAGSFTEDSNDASFVSHCGENELPDRARLFLLTQKLLKEVRDKSKGWISCLSCDHVDVAVKKVCTFSSNLHPNIILILGLETQSIYRDSYR